MRIPKIRTRATVTYPKEVLADLTMNKHKVTRVDARRKIRKNPIRRKSAVRKNAFGSGGYTGVSINAYFPENGGL